MMKKISEWMKVRRQNKEVRKQAEADLKKLDTPTPDPGPFVAMASPMAGVTPTMESHSVTGAYQTVRAMMDDAIAQKRKARSAAQRLSNSISAAPELRTPVPVKFK